jgi:uncharacterized protein (DUF2225 family)
MKRFILTLVILLSISIGVKATTWFPAEHTCPVCKHTHEYQEIGSYGGYIYSWPSKYQLIFWPYTDSPVVYSCPECHFSTYMWDFDSIPENKMDTLTEYLSTVKMDKEKDYTDIPITTRLEIAEDVYQILGRDRDFWCHFYRVMGYHYHKTQNTEKAREARLTALSLARESLADPDHAGQEKETWFIIAAMHNFTGQMDSALYYLDKASLLSYKNKTWEKENEGNYDSYLTDLIPVYKEFIKKGEEE